MILKRAKHDLQVSPYGEKRARDEQSSHARVDEEIQSDHGVVFVKARAKKNTALVL